MTIYRNPVPGSTMKAPLGCVDSLTQCVAMGALTLLVVGCTRVPESAALEEARTRLRFELPTGAQVMLPGTDTMVAAPAEAVDVEAGTHDIAVAWGCHSAQVQIVVAPGEAEVVDRAAVPELVGASFVAKATSRKGEPLAVDVFVDDVRWATAQYGEAVAVPACRQRMRIVATPPDPQLGLGGFIEDIELGADEVVTREVVLAPGPDMVRIHGGPFTLGVPDGALARWDEQEKQEARRAGIPWDEWDEEGDGPLPGFLDRRKTQVATFDIDRTEVTADEFLACRRAADDPRPNRELQMCYDDAECAKLEGCYFDVRERDGAGDESLPHCTVPGRTRPQVAKPGHGDHAANCVPINEAKRYCAWVGKRLMTDEEWEYAARSGKDTYEWPWGNEPYDCDRGRDCRDPRALGAMPPMPTCAAPLGNSEQGVCDLVSNVVELVTAIHPQAEARYLAANYWSSGQPSHQNGFRCARSVDRQPPEQK